MKKVNGILKRHKNISAIVIIFISLCLLSYHFFITKKSTTKIFLDGYENGFFLSFAASLFEDLLIFSSLSLIVIILTTQNILDYSFDDKIRSIVNNDNAVGNEAIIDFLKLTVSEILAYDYLLEIHLTIAAYDEKKSAYKLYFHYTFRTKNMCKDKDRKKKDSYFYVTPSDIDVNGERGFVTLLELKDLKNKLVTTVTKETLPFFLDKKYEQYVPMPLSKDGEVETNFKFNIWSSTGDFVKESTAIWNMIRCERFVAKAKMVVVNQLDKPVEFELYANLKREKISLNLQQNGLIYPGELPLNIEPELYPADDVRIFFYKQKKGET